MENTNEMLLEFDSRSLNEGFVRVAVAAFATQLNPTLEEVADLKTAVSEAVTNAIIHAYGGQAEKIRVNCRVREREMEVEVVDHGVGIRDVPKAMEPMYTTKPELDRSGTGRGHHRVDEEKIWLPVRAERSVRGGVISAYWPGRWHGTYPCID